MKNIGLFSLISLMLFSCAEEDVQQYSEPEGKLAKESIYKPETTAPQGTIRYEYDLEGKLVRKTYDGYITFDVLLERANEDYIYDDQKRLIRRMKYYESYGDDLRADYEYNALGQLEKIREVSNSTILYFFDDQEQNIRIEYYVGNGVLMNRYVDLEYNQDHQLIRESSYSRIDDNSFELGYQYESEYDQEGKLLRRRAVDGTSGNPDGFVAGVMEEYFHDSGTGLLTEKKFYNPWQDYVLTHVTRYEYY